MVLNLTFASGSEEFGADIPITLTEKFVLDVYACVDAATKREVDRLSNEDGITPVCKKDCWYCCRYHILTNVAEGHTLAQYIKRDMPADQINELRIRTQQWHARDNPRPGRYPTAYSAAQPDLSHYDHCCPLLVKGACSAYPVRPVVCRTHLVRSNPLLCQAANDPKTTQAPPIVLKSVVMAATPFAATIKDHIEQAGLDFSRSIMLLPHWLAMEMRWDFDPSS